MAMDERNIKDLPAYLRGLNPQQKEAVLHGSSRPLLILAGAGSGKTRVITTRIAFLIDQLGFNPRSILAVTFTNKAAREMKERVTALVPHASEVMIRTFHSFGSWVMRRNAEILGYKSTFSIYDDDDSLALLKGLYPDLPRQEIKQYSRWISRAKDDCLTPDDREELKEITWDDDFPEVYRSYQEKLQSTGSLDFGDLIMKPVELLQGSRAISERMHQRFKVILVDEYQDSNGAQDEMLKQLAGPDTWLCVVGDDDQSIYRFRGADVTNILRFGETFAETRVIRLEQNYRSTEHILRLASKVVENNSGRLGKTLWTDRGEGVKARLVYRNDSLQEAEFCADLVEQEGNPGGTAILYRTNAQSRNFETLLKRRGIPYRLVGTVGFFQREEIKDVLAFLALLSNPADEVAFRRVINKPAKGIGPASLSKIVALRGEAGGSWIEAARLAGKRVSGRAGKGAGDFAAFFDEILEGGAETLAELVQRTLRITGLQDYYHQEDLMNGTMKSQNLEELVNAAAEYDAGDEGLSRFLEQTMLDQGGVGQEEEGADEAVTLITMHNTKGLEFDRVIITGMEEGLFPRASFLEDPEELEEERRLFYVAITRARRELFFTSCRRRMLYGRTEIRQPSRFLEELDEDSLEIEGGEVPISPWAVGTRVFHDDYGVGTVVKEWFNGNYQVVFVRFDSGMTARFLPELTPLEKISGDDV